MNQEENSLLKRAYHEAGHVVAAYLAGFVCHSMELLGKNPLSNKGSYDFGDDIHLIYAMYKYKENPDVYDNLPQVAKNKCPEVALKTIIVLMGGSSSEAVYKNGGKVEINPFFTILVHDLEAADNIDYFLSIIKQGQHPTNYLQGVFRQVLKLMEIKEVWNAVSALAERIVESEETKLERKDIEKILIETGFLAYLSNLRCNKSHPNSHPPENSETNINAQQNNSAQSPDRFTREELEKLKQQQKQKPTQNPPISKKESVVKIINFAKGLKYSHFQIGITNDPDNDIFGDDKIDKNDKNSYLIIETSSYAVAKEIQMYFVCLGMEIAPGSSKNKEASTVFLILK